MSETRQQYTTVTQPVGGICYVDDVPDVREYLLNLRRDLLRKVHDLDELIARLPEPRKG